MKRQHIEEEEEVLRKINEASDAIRRKYQMIKTGRADADRVYADILKPVVTPLKVLVRRALKTNKQLSEARNKQATHISETRDGSSFVASHFFLFVLFTL